MMSLMISHDISDKYKCFFLLYFITEMIVITIIEKRNTLSFNSIGTQCCIQKHCQGEAKQVLAEIKGDEAPIHVCRYMAN